MPTWRNTTGDGLWGTAGNWLTDGSGSGVPTSGTDATFDSLSPSCTVNAINRDCRNLIFQTGYANTFTIANGITLTVFGTAITLISSMTYNQTTTGILSTSTGNQPALTITFANITIPNLRLGKTNLALAIAQTVTISGTTPTIKNLVIANGTGSTILTGSAITITGSLNNTQGAFTNNTGQIIFSGACTISCTGGATISGGFIVSSGNSLQMLTNINLQTGTITFTAGATLINTGLFTLFCPGIVTFNTSPVTWYNITLSASGQIYPLLSVLNISNNLTISSSTDSVAFSGGFAINLSGNLLTTSTDQLGLGGGILNMLGSGLIDVSGVTNGTLNINGTGTYTIGSATNPTFSVTNLTLNLVGTSTAQVYSTTSHTLSSGGGLTLRTNNTATGAGIGGSQIIWGNISLTTNTTSTLIYDTIALGNLSSVQHTLNGVGVKLYVEGNLSVTTSLNGTAIIELNGSVNKTWGNGTYTINITANKSGAAVITAGTTITWGIANRTLIMNSAVNFLANSTTFTLSGGPLTINNTFGNNPFFRVNIPASTLNINGNPLRVNENLTLTAAGATFEGAFGWDCNNLICSTAGPYNITLQQGVTYRTRTGVSLTGGTDANRVTMQSSSGSVRAIWTLDFGATQSLIYVNGTRIDSSGEQTVWSFGVSAANVSTSINWNPGVPLRTVAYTFVN